MGATGNPTLTAIRESRGITLEAIAASTKISTHYLKAIEAGEPKKLPGEFYARSYVRQYARAVGLAEDELLERLDLLPKDRESTELRTGTEKTFVWRHAEEGR